MQQILRHWVLNIAVEGRRKLSDFVPYVECEYLNVREVPGAMATDYASAVAGLLDAGLIRFYNVTTSGVGTEVGRSAVDSVLQTRLHLPKLSGKVRSRQGEPRASRAISPPTVDLSFELTPLGGKEWESRAEPDWGRYGPMLTGDESGEAWSAGLDLLLAMVGWYRELNGAQIDRNSVSINVLQDHPITYWKRLPTVYHATFACKWAGYRWDSGFDEPDWFRDWWTSQSAWFRRPWELPDWPSATSAAQT
jgi:hypothetical protein